VVGMKSVGVGDVALPAAMQGDSASWDDLVEAVLPVVWQTIVGAGVEGEDAAEISQLVWLRVAQNLHEFATAEALATWAVTTAALESRRLVHHQAMRSARDARATANRVIHLRPGFVTAEGLTTA